MSAACLFRDSGSAKLRDERRAAVEQFASLPQKYRLVRSEPGRERSVVELDRRGVAFGAEALVICAGPCSVESQTQVDETAEAVVKSGASVLRGGAFKPRSSPYAFQGLGERGLKLLRAAADRHELAVVTEVLDVRHVEVVAQYADMLQIGARNMQNFSLLREVGQSGKPVLLKRGLAATVDEWLMAAEYILLAGNDRVVLCERGVRSFDSTTRNLLDLAVIPLLRQLTHLPVIVDPSHGTGIARLVEPMALAAVAAGADGLLVEVHPEPHTAASDGAQSLRPAEFAHLMRALPDLARVAGRSVASDAFLPV
ncbi:MAG: 3-deoxy-7-phosphoheptulonate synthase [Candidatus Eremiobacteraeota bacterium]|nr:3-deoxy-7-phosphoheptulonate synthase [Candidatus Eremiobacteraeota bacterium]